MCCDAGLSAQGTAWLPPQGWCLGNLHLLHGWAMLSSKAHGAPASQAFQHVVQMNQVPDCRGCGRLCKGVPCGHSPMCTSTPDLSADDAAQPRRPRTPAQLAQSLAPSLPPQRPDPRWTAWSCLSACAHARLQPGFRPGLGSQLSTSQQPQHHHCAHSDRQGRLPDDIPGMRLPAAQGTGSQTMRS